MEEAPTQSGPMPSAPMRKACQINIMFPIEDDEQAMHVKAAIDGVVGDIKDKRYTFNISEM
jgi:hypothetical protein